MGKWIVIAVMFAAVVGGFGVFLHDLGVLAEDLYPWGKDGASMDGASCGSSREREDGDK